MIGTRKAWKQTCEDIANGYVWNQALLNQSNLSGLATEIRVVDFHDVWTAFDAERHLALMTVWRNDDALEPSNAAVRHGRIVVYRKGANGPGHAGHPSMNFIDYGLGILTADAVMTLTPAQVPHDLSSLYETIAARGRLQAYEVGQRFHEIGSEAGLAELDRLLTVELQP